MIKSVYFWVATLLFVAVVAITGGYLLPPAFSNLSEQRSKVAELTKELADEEKFAAALNSLKDEEARLDSLYGQATQALPAKPDAEGLMLQLDGLLQSLNIGKSTLGVPLTHTTSGGSGTEGQTAPQTEIAATIAGNFDYTTFQSLLSSLKTFIRWNKVNSFSISKAGDSFTVSVETRAFYKPGATKEFSGSTQVLSNAETLFGALKSYATTPDVTVEGSYGKANPFSP